jgi:hypothetical protein
MIGKALSNSRSEEMYEYVLMLSLGYCFLVQLDVIDCGLDILYLSLCAAKTPVCTFLLNDLGYQARTVFAFILSDYLNEYSLSPHSWHRSSTLVNLLG